MATLGVIPLGTSNVLARELKIASLEDALARVARGTSRPISVGELECAGQKRRFLLMAGVGVDGAVVQAVRLGEKKLVGKGAYLLSALRILARWDRGELQVTGGGRSLSCHSVIVCNASRYGGNFLLAPEADLFSPGFQVLCIKGGRLSYLRLALLLGLNRVAASRSVTLFQASELEVAGDKAVQLDPTSRDVHYEIGRLLLKKGDAKGAAKAGEEALRMAAEDDTDLQIRYLLVRAYETAGEDDLAIECPVGGHRRSPVGSSAAR